LKDLGANMDVITDRILSQIGDMELIERLLSLPKSDFSSLLLKLFHEQANKATPTDLLKSFQVNRFSVPSEISLDSEYEENNYYKGIHFEIYMQKENQSIEIGDGGFVDWTQKMTGSGKERCLISGIGIDRLLI